MVGTILFRMILWELCKVFVMALIAITGILLMAGLIAEATQQGLAPSQILAAIPLLIPSTLPYTIPATTLFATCVVYGRLSADNEILAIKAAGVNLIHVVKPGVVLGLIMSCCTMALYYQIIPSTHHMLRSMILNDAEEVLYSLLRRHGMINHPQLPYAMFVRGVEGKKLLHAIFKKKNPRGQIEVVAHAREAELRVDTANKQVLVHMRFGVAIGEDGARANFDDRKFDVELSDALNPSNDKIRARDLTWEQLKQQRVTLLAEVEAVKKLSVDISRLPVPEGGPPLELQLKLLREKLTMLNNQIRHIDVEMLMRPALSLGCLCFILVGCPVGIWFSRGDYLSAFITCFLPIVIVYYPLMLCGTNLAKEGRFNELVLVFAADVILAVWGMILFRRLLKN